VTFETPPPFEEEIHVSPYELFRRLQEGERPPLVDLRDAGLTLVGARRGLSSEEWPAGAILIDHDGRQASARAREIQALGREVKALYGGIELWDFALDPLVVGEERFLAE
jgi:hypothetical protein